MDSRGNISIEIGLVLIVILIIAGAVLNFSDIMTQKAITASESENTEVLITEAIDNLINNPGVPDNWQKNKKGMPGLAIINEGGETIPNSVSYFKFLALSKNYKKLVDEKMFDSKIKTSMELIPRESSISSVKIGNDKENCEVFSVNRLVKCDFYNKYVIKTFQNAGKCNHKHKQDTHSCNYFKVFPGNLRASDYYLLIDKQEKNDVKYVIDTTRVVKARPWQSPSSDRIYLNTEISFYDDTSAVVFIHFDKPHAKALLVCVPKTFDKSKLSYDYFRVNDCNLILKAWY
ncbi:TadE/TadG family type IV pilus assembly protein [uncultured Methanobrevibacter sp.]|uniref:TadE/TadG family type IV pilus assembly protein n=1 Tax=uncultured Methanobrevibacter sp. TaxID=253161 RepID=UPI0026234A41|nr:hypothetical protein [uncultured Methanobrevibacter sp.]